MTHCNVCGNPFVSPIYQAQENYSITSMSTLIEGSTVVFFCDICGHLQTAELPDLQSYYQYEYQINIKSEDDDQIYKVTDGKLIYRSDHQAETLMTKIPLKPGDRVLDYGCAKALTLKKVLACYPGIEPFLYDVTEKYIPFWLKYPKPPQWSVYNLNPAWQGTMDVVLSFYALEHIADLKGALNEIKSVLKPGGYFFFIVPNVYKNPADFIVADHVNHFSTSSLQWLLSANGFDCIDIDENAHDAAFVVSARLAEQKTRPGTVRLSTSESLLKIRRSAHALATYWINTIAAIRDYENKLPETELVAIYGAGFYGHMIAYTLSRLDRVICFVDQNPHLRNTTIEGRTVVPPEELPEHVSNVLVGLNPSYARSVIEAIPVWRTRRLSFFYL